jgi:hypothetical protein
MRALVPALIVALMPIFTPPVLAQRLSELSACLPVDDAAARLECYDGLAAMAANEADRGDTGGWLREEWPSRLNAAWTDYEVWSAALNSIPGAAGIPVHPVLAVRCEQGETQVFFSFGRQFQGETIRVYYRLGSGEIQPGELTLTPDGRRFGLWSTALAVRFVQALRHSERLRIQVPVAGGEPLTAAFELGGLSAAAEPLMQACAWE